MDFITGFKEWVRSSANTSDHASAMVETLKDMGLYSNGANGNSGAKRDVRDIPIFCTPLEDLYRKPLHALVDVFNLKDPLSRLAFKEHGNLILKGPKGNGKSLLIRTLASEFNVPLVVVECSENTKDTTLLGSFLLVNKETVFSLGPLPKAIEAANSTGKAILLFEEFNALTPQSQKLINGVSQERAVEIRALEKTYKLNEGCEIWIVATMNPSCYGGAYDVNEDLKSRFGEIEIQYAPHSLELGIVKTLCGTALDQSIMDSVIKIADSTRRGKTGYALSTRDVVRTIKTIGVLGRDAAMQMLACKFEGEDRKIMIKEIQDQFIGLKLKNSWGE